MFWIGARIKDGLAIHRVRISVQTEDYISGPRIVQLISLALRPVRPCLAEIKSRLLQAQHSTLASAINSLECELVEKADKHPFDELPIPQFALLLRELVPQNSYLSQDEKDKLVRHCNDVVKFHAIQSRACVFLIVASNLS